MARQTAALLSTVLVMTVFSGYSWGQLSLTLTGLEAPVLESSDHGTGAPGQTTLSVPMGAPVSLRIELRNDGLSSITMPVTALPGSLLRLYLLHPDGTNEPLSAERWERICQLLLNREFGPGQSVVHETFVFENFLYDKPDRRFKSKYLFPSPGNYEVFAKYICADPPMSLESNHLTVVVGPPIPNWEALKEAGIVDEIERRDLSTPQGLQRHTAIVGLLADQPQSPLSAWLNNAPVAASQPAGLPQALATQPAAPAIPASECIAVVTSFLTAYTAGNLVQAANCLSDDYKLGGVLSKQETLATLEQGVPAFGGAPFGVLTENITTEPTGQDMHVFVTVTYIPNGATSGTPRWLRFTVKQDNGQLRIRASNEVDPWIGPTSAPSGIP